MCTFFKEVGGLLFPETCKFSRKTNMSRVKTEEPSSLKGRHVRHARVSLDRSGVCVFWSGRFHSGCRKNVTTDPDLFYSTMQKN